MQPKIVPNISLVIDTFTKNGDSSIIIENDMTQSFLEKPNNIADQGDSGYIRNKNEMKH